MKKDDVKVKHAPYKKIKELEAAMGCQLSPMLKQTFADIPISICIFWFNFEKDNPPEVVRVARGIIERLDATLEWGRAEMVKARSAA